MLFDRLARRALGPDCLPPHHSISGTSRPTCKQLSAKHCTHDDRSDPQQGSIILLQYHPDYPVFSAIQRGDTEALPHLLARLTSRPEIGLSNRARTDRLFYWTQWHILDLAEACICVLLTDRNDDRSQLWLPVMFLAKMYLNDTWPTDSIADAVTVAYRRSHFRSIIAFGQAHRGSLPSFDDWNGLFAEICARKLVPFAKSTPYDSHPKFTADTKLQVLEALLRIFTPPLFTGDLDFITAIAHPNNNVGTIIHLTVTLFEDRNHRKSRAECLVRLLDACGEHNRPNVFPLLMQLYLIARHEHQHEPEYAERFRQALPVGPDTIFPTSIDDVIFKVDAQLSAHGVSPSTTIRFRQLLAHCNWHRDFVPWLLAISGTDNQQPFALKWFLSHVPINLALIHLLPMAVCMFKPLQCQKMLLAQCPIDIPAGLPQHGPKGGANWGCEPWDEDDWACMSQVQACARCVRIEARAEAVLRTSGAGADAHIMRSVAKRLVDPDQWQVFYVGRPDVIVREEARAVQELLMQAGGCDVQVGKDDGWSLAEWATGFLTGKEVYRLWTVAKELRQRPLLPFPISFQAVVNALIGLGDFELAGKVVDEASGHATEAAVPSRTCSWVVSIRAVKIMLPKLLEWSSAEQPSSTLRLSDGYNGVCRLISEAIAGGQVFGSTEAEEEAGCLSEFTRLYAMFDQ